MTTHTDPFPVAKAIFTTTPPPPSIECKAPLGGRLGSTNIRTLYLVQLGVGQATYGSINKNAPSATIFLSYAEWQAVADAVAFASTRQVTLNVTCIDRTDPYADVTSVVPAPMIATSVLLQAIQTEISAVAVTTNAIHQQIAQDVSVEVHKISELVRVGFVKLGVPAGELPLAALEAPSTSEYPSEPPPGDSEAPPAYFPKNNSFDDRPQH